MADVRTAGSLEDRASSQGSPHLDDKRLQADPGNILRPVDGSTRTEHHPRIANNA